MLPSKIRIKKTNNQDLANKANYIEDEKYIKLYCRRKGITVEQFLGEDDTNSENTSKNKDS